MLRKWKKDTRCIFFSFMSVNLSFDFELLYLSIKFSVTNCCWDKWGSWWWSAIGCKLWQFVLVGRKRTLSSLKIHNPYFSVVPDFIWRINLMDIGEETVWSDYLCFLQNNIKWFFFFFLHSKTNSYRCWYLCQQHWSCIINKYGKRLANKDFYLDYWSWHQY